MALFWYIYNSFFPPKVDPPTGGDPLYLTLFRRQAMPTNPKTGTKSKFVMSTIFLFWKLTEIEKHLRDCSQDIVDFAKFLASRLDFVAKPEMKPWDFAKEWKATIEDIAAIKNSINPQIGPAHAIKHSPLRYWVSRFSYLGMMPIFAEDLCGKDFAEVATLAIIDDVSKTEPFIYTIKPNTRPMTPSNFRNLAEIVHPGFSPDPFHFFPPEPPVMIQDAEHTPAPPGHEFTGHEGWDC